MIAYNNLCLFMLFMWLTILLLFKIHVRTIANMISCKLVVIQEDTYGLTDALVILRLFFA